MPPVFRSSALRAALVVVSLIVAAPLLAQTTPAAEVCDGIDNDVDGLIDEGAVCETQPTTCTCSPVAKTVACQAKDCGSAPDGCSGSIVCGTCATGFRCNRNVCERI